MRAWVAAGIVCAGLAGCATLGPPPATRQTNERASPPALAQSAPTAWSTPAQAVSAFASAYINWTAATVAAELRALAARSVGQARSAMQLAAAETAHDYELQNGGIANSGTVEAIAPLPGRRDQYVVVTEEQTTANDTGAYQGLRPAWHVAIATVVQLTIGRWVVSGWQPEN